MIDLTKLSALCFTRQHEKCPGKSESAFQKTWHCICPCHKKVN